MFFWATLLSVVLIGVITVKGMRYVMRLTGTTELFKDGATLTEDGIEFLGGCFRKRRATLSEIESVDLVPFRKAMVSTLLMHYGRPVHEIRTRFGSDYVLVKLKPRARRWFEYYFEYVMFTPKCPAQFAEKLSSRIRGYEKHVA